GTPSYVVGNEVVFGAQGRDLLNEKVAVAKAACAASAAFRGATSDHSSFGRERRGITAFSPFSFGLSQTIEGPARRRSMARAEGFHIEDGFRTERPQPQFARQARTRHLWRPDV